MSFLRECGTFAGYLGDSDQYKSDAILWHKIAEERDRVPQEVKAIVEDASPAAEGEEDRLVLPDPHPSPQHLAPERLGHLPDLQRVEHGRSWRRMPEVSRCLLRNQDGELRLRCLVTTSSIVIMRSLAGMPLSRLIKSADKLLDNRKGIGTKALNLLTGLRVTDVDTDKQRADRY